METQIRQLSPQEWQTYRDVRLAALQDAPDVFGGSYEASAAYPEQLWRDWCSQPSWFAFTSDGPIGMVRVAWPVEGERVELISMWVAPGARGTSAAADLVHHVVTWAGARGCSGVALRVMDGNRRAQAFYERVGFVDNGIREALPDGRTEVEMVHVLAPSRDTTVPRPGVAGA